MVGLSVSREMPVGRISGTVVMQENGQPLEDATVYIDSTGNADYPVQAIASTDKTGWFRSRSLPAGAYRVSLYSAHHRIEKHIVQVEEGEPLKAKYQATPTKTELDTSLNQRVQLPTESPSITLTGFTRQKQLNIEVWRVKDSTLIANGGPAAALRLALSGKHPSFATRARQFMFTPTGRDKEGGFVQHLELKPLPEGIYWVAAAADDVKSSVAMYVTSAAMVTKSSPEATDCFVVDMAKGTPVGGAPVYSVSGTSLTSVGHTDSTGMLHLPRSSVGRGMLVSQVGKSWASTDFLGDSDTSDKGTIAFITDRTIYRPGDLVQYKAVIRTRSGNELTLPGGGSAEVEVLDADEEAIDTKELPVNVHGSVSGSFRTSKEAKPGLYQLHCTYNGVESRHFVSVAAYRKPDFSLKVAPAADHFVYGQEVVFNADLTYYFGGPVVGATVRASITRGQNWSRYDAGDDEDTSDDSPPEGAWGEGGNRSSGEYLQEITATTDENGRAVLRLPSKQPDDPASVQSDYTYTVTATCSDGENAPTFTGTADVLVARGELTLAVRPSSYVLSPDHPTEFVIRANDVRKGHAPLAGLPIKVEYGTASRKGPTLFDSSRTVTVTTNERGTISLSATSKPKQSLVIRATAIDSGGRKIEAECNLYSTDRDYADSEQRRIDFVLDKKEYKQGDTAVALITCPEPGGFAWVTTEATSLISSVPVWLRERSTRVEIPVTTKCFPSAYISVAYVHGKHYFEASRQITLARTPKRLTVIVTPDRSQVEPGQHIGVSVETRDASGRGVPAETSLAVVDESLFALQGDSTNLMHEFYPPGRNYVRTSYSFPEIYLDGGDKGASSVPIRTKFLDTAWWMPTLVTDANGKAHCDIPLPENLTKWRVTVQGVTDSTLVGKGVSSVIAKKPLMVLASLPRFMVKGDRQDVTVSIHNDSESTQQLKLLIRSHGIKIESEVPGKLRLDAGKAESLSLTVSATETGEAWLSVQALADSRLSDGVKQTMPVYARGRKEHFEESLVVNGGGSSTVTMPQGVDPATVELKVQYAPTIAASLIASVDSLVGYPYGCVEQTMSKLLPTLVVAKLLRENGIDKPEIDTKVPMITQDALARLAKMQHADGAWGWWENDDSTVQMTALVLDGIKRAQEAGATVDIKTQRALEWLGTTCKTPKQKKENARWEGYAPAPHELAYAAYVLARWEQVATAADVLKLIDMQKASPTTVAYVALANGCMGRPFVTKRDAAIQQLLKQVDRNSGLTAWRETWFWSSDTAQPTAIALLALMQAGGQDATVAEVAKSLVKLRKGAMWESTQSTSYCVLALAEYLHRTKELVAQKSVAVRLNGKAIGARAWRAGEMSSGTVVINGKDLKEGANVIEFNSTGGTVYAQVDAKFVVVGAEDRPVESKDFTVNRVYRVMETQQLENGTKRLMASKRVVTQVKVGDIVQVEIHVNTKDPIDFVMLEDPIPSNFKVVERDAIGDEESWSYVWDGIQIFDNRVALFMTHLIPSDGIIRYKLRAESAGEATALPTRVEPMYAPNKAVSSAAARLVVK